MTTSGLIEVGCATDRRSDGPARLIARQCIHGGSYVRRASRTAVRVIRDEKCAGSRREEREVCGAALVGDDGRRGRRLRLVANRFDATREVAGSFYQPIAISARKRTTSHRTVEARTRGSRVAQRAEPQT